MQKSLIILVIVLALGGGALWFFSQPRGVSFGGVDFGGHERAWLAERSVDFFEDIQFKDFKKASTYHLDETQKARDIPELIRQRFGIKHEVLDITQYKVLDVDLDRSKERARVRMLVMFRVLGDKLTRNDKEGTRDTELLLYWFRKKDGKWHMELESSLR